MKLKQICMALLFVGIFAATASEARAQTRCELYFGGEARDVFDNVTYNTLNGYVYAYHYDYNSCWDAVTAFMDDLSYTICLGRSSTVEVDYLGELWWDTIFIDYVPMPKDSCVDDWGLNSYSTLTAGQTLYPTDSLASPSGYYRLDYQSDANLVLYEGASTAVWAINCWPGCTNIGSAGRATMQNDGNFVVYDSLDNPVFDTQTSGWSGAFLAVRNNGRLVVYDHGGDVLWAN